jgi:peptidoglycan DL-endopeptidase CwlO
VRRLRLCVAALATAALCVSTVPAAVADHGGGHRADQGKADHQSSPAVPTQAQVDAARARATRTAHDVGAIKAQLLMANQRREAADLRAEQASEAYNGAMYRLELAKQNVVQARAEAARARRSVSRQRDAIGALVVTSYQQGSQLTALNAMMSADGPEGVLDQYAGFQGASTSLQADYERFAATEALAQVFERKAEQAKATQARLAAMARGARDRAESAAAQAQQAATQVAAQKQQLIRQLAAAQHISVHLARQRQNALEQLARERAEARARAAALAKARAEAKAEAAAKAAAQKAAHQAAQEAAAKAAAAKKAAGKAAQSSAQNATAPAPAADPAPVPAPAPAAAPAAVRSGVQSAIAFAKAQLGEPYRWGGTGPTSWDCSGLTQGAWGAAGVYLPHYSVAQYYAGTPIPIGSARPGDLLFWSSNGSPSGIHHVALYLGGGDFIEAPHTGADVRYNSIYSWYPDFAVRL